MPLQNRVTPRNELIAVPARGMFTGNRGCLHDDAGQIRRAHRGQRWIVCELRFKDRKARLMEPGLYTHLFFLDEATALAAGHRPCAECRRPAFRAFLDAWTAGNRADRGSRIGEVDGILHRQRLNPRERASLDGLPDGAFVGLDDDPRPFLVLGDALLAWTPDGYADRRPRSATTVEVLTPASTVKALRAGYRPVLHHTAAER